MKWEEGREGEVEDRRGLTAGHYVGGGGIGLLVIALIGYFFFHINPDQILSAADSGPGAPVATGQQTSLSQPTDPEGKFSATIYASADDTWSAIFAKQGKAYHKPKMVLYTEDTGTACGEGQSAMGPFYCPEDESIYLDVDFFQTLDQQLGAPGDFAKSYVIAHEFGHHIQKLLGVSDAVEKKEQGMSQSAANALSVKVELQADCYAGVWAQQSNKKMNWIEAGDIDEAMNAAAAVGDDTLQKETQGTVVPDSFTHGTSAQRQHWFKAGYQTGDPSSCDTFDASL